MAATPLPPKTAHGASGREVRIAALWGGKHDGTFICLSRGLVPQIVYGRSTPRPYTYVPAVDYGFFVIYACLRNG